MDLQIDISLELWKGNIPLELVVAANDQTSSTKLSSCFIFVSRMSYLNVVAADSVDYLKAFAIDLASDVWFESNGSPLKCNIPVGVLFDLNCSQNITQPWKIIVHFRDFPGDKILKCNTREAAEKIYLHTLKQALFVLQGNTRAFNDLVLEQQQLLWEGANSGSRGTFESVASELRGASEIIKCIPIRILLLCQDNTKAGESPTHLCIQRPVHIFKDQSQETQILLEDVLQQFIPEKNLSSNNIFIHGIHVPFETPILPLWKMCSHADFFLYIVVIVD